MEDMSEFMHTSAMEFPSKATTNLSSMAVKH